MRRAAGIALVVTLSIVGGIASLTSWLHRGGGLSLRSAHGAPSAANWLEEAADAPLRTSGPREPTSGGKVIVRNDMPAAITVLARPDRRIYRLGWGGGDLVLGPDPVDTLAVLYHDPYWPYVYAVTCPATDHDVRIRMSELWHGRAPAGFEVWRGRPGPTGIVWFDVVGEGRVEDESPEFAVDAPPPSRT